MRARRLAAADVAALTPHALEGAVLLRSVVVEDARISKGTRIDAGLAERLATAGLVGDLRELHVAWPDAHDLHEDEAARELGLAVGGGGVDMREPRQSRCDLVALWDGVLHLKLAPLLAINAIDPLEVFTLLHGQAVAAGDVVASVKVAPHLVATEIVRLGLHVAVEQGPVIEVRPYRGLDVGGLIASPIGPDQRARFEAGARLKVEALGSRFAGVATVAERDPVAAVAELQALLGALCLERRLAVLLVAGVSAGDPLHPFCEALNTLGGRFVRRGLPAHPGSMLWIARLGATQLLGLPQCGMFSLATAADLVLPRLLTGEQLDAAAIAELAHGGLLGREMRFRFPPYARTLDAPEDA